MKSKLLFTFVFLFILFSFSYALIAHKTSIQAAPADAPQIVTDEKENAVRILIEGREKVRIDSSGVYVFDGAYFHGPAPEKEDNKKGGRP